MSKNGVVGLVMGAFGLVTVFVLIPTQISRLSAAILATGVSPRAFPLVAAWGVTAFGLVLCVQDLIAQRRAVLVPPAAAPEETPQLQRNAGPGNGEPAEGSDPVALILFFGAIVAYVGLLPVLGHVVATPLAIAGFMVLLGERRWFRIVLTALLTTGVLAVFFRALLNTILPTGILF